MCGARDAASNWAGCCATLAMNIGAASRSESPCAFRHRSRDAWSTGRGDDFALRGGDAALDWFEVKMKGGFEPEVQR
eukprot:8042880-Pyramimonas_sp.AAC.1